MKSWMRLTQVLVNSRIVHVIHETSIMQSLFNGPICGINGRIDAIGMSSKVDFQAAAEVADIGNTFPVQQRLILQPNS